MRALMADNNVDGQLQTILVICQSAAWQEIWESLKLDILTFEGIGLLRTAPDVVLWQECQRREIALVTANRRAGGDDSLERTIRAYNTPTSLPVFTLADAPRIQREGHYAERVAVQLLQYLMEIDNVRGTGRLYLP
jgi:hypothetical protein